jgi:AcrR family transcriptional regulator
MTRHRSREDRVVEILASAAEVVDELGYPALTMDAVARRTALSKGGIYRYFANKDDLALALFEVALEAEVHVDEPEVFGWRLPLLETLLRLMMHDHRTVDAARLHRIFLQLLPETLLKPTFRRVKQQIEDRYVERYGRLVVALLARDGIAPVAGFLERLAVSLRLAATLMEGMTYRLIGGTSHDELEAQCRRFLEVMLHAALEAHDA